MKILLVTDLFPLFENEKGIPQTILNFAQGFLENGEDVKIFRPNLILNVLVRKRKLYKKGIYKNAGLEIINKNFLFFNRASVLRAYKKFFKDEKFDVVLAHMPSGILCGNIIAKEFNLPFFASVHSSDIKVLEDLKYLPFKRKMVEAYQNAVCILPRSFWLKDKIRKVLPGVNKPVEIVYSGIPLKIIEKNEKLIRNYDPKKAKILTVSSLIERKNLKNLILAYRKIKKIYPKISFEIAGDGPLREKFEKFIFKKKLDIKLLGQISKEEVYKKMLDADIFILPSKNETFGMVYMEALSAGMAVVCTKNSGVDGIIENERNGFLCGLNVKSIYSVLKRILSLKEKEFLEISKNAITSAKMFSYENSIQNYLNKIKVFKI